MLLLTLPHHATTEETTIQQIKDNRGVLNEEQGITRMRRGTRSIKIQDITLHCRPYTRQEKIKRITENYVEIVQTVIFHTND